MLWESDACAPMASARRESRAAGGNPAARSAADWLCLAATPTFVVMALLTGILGGGAPDMMCMGAPRGFALSGMIPMYLLMSVFHAGPWLKLITGRPRASGA
jgi:CBS domain containing-hemolysin-like protein